MRLGSEIEVLAMRAVVDAPRVDDSAFEAATLAGIDLHLGRLQATWHPRDWGGMVVKGVWEPLADGGLDLTVHLQADSVDELQAVEIEVGSRLRRASTSASGPAPESIGRAATSADATVLPGFEPHPSTAWIHEEASGRCYVELCGGHDLSRSSLREEADGELLEHALFGHALEKGVVLRARLRGYWFETRPTHEQVIDLLSRFRAEPLPIGI
ncbi:MAG: hypothetical protein SFX72_13150 [Isosphaeraceae bacterium]|nr:hypothetical protein [Isosphaeraceae bacterium]